MKILYTIFTTSHGNGGHFYSLVTTAKAMTAKADVTIINFGLKKSPVIESSGIKSYNILLNSNGIVRAYKKFKKIVKEEDPNVLHSFCTLSYFFVRTHAMFKPIKTILTKCGGPNPKRYFPVAKNLILYSKENFDYFKSKKKFRSSKLYLIPNRVLEQKSDNKRIDELKDYLQLKENQKIFLRIGRIARHYESSIIQAINLVNELNQKESNYLLILIGSVQGQTLFDELRKIDNNALRIVSETRFTSNASELIGIADFVIGTGRSLMEAAAKGKVLLTPNKNSKYPVLINEKNFKPLFDNNFSPRGFVSVDDSFHEKMLQDLQSINKRYNEFSRELFLKYFDINSKKNYYLDLYTLTEVHKEKLSFDFLFHYLFLKNYLRKY